MGARICIVQFNRSTKATSLDVVAYHRIQLREAIGQTRPADHEVGNIGQKFLNGRQAARNVGLVNLGSCRSEFHPQSDPESLVELLLFEYRFERLHIQVRQLVEVVSQAWLGEGNSDIVFSPFLHRLDDDRQRRIGLRAGNADTFRLQLVAEDVEQVARPKHLQGLGPIRADLRHQTQPAADHLLREYLGFRGEWPQPEHHRHVAHVPPFPEHHYTDDGFDVTLGPIDVPRRLSRLFQISSSHLTRVVGVDYEHFRFPEAQSPGAPQVVRQVHRRRGSSPP